MAHRRPLQTVTAVFPGGLVGFVCGNLVNPVLIHAGFAPIPEPYIVSASSAIGGPLGEVFSQGTEPLVRRREEKHKAHELSTKIESFLAILAQAQKNHRLEAPALQRLAVRLGERRTEWQTVFYGYNGLRNQDHL